MRIFGMGLGAALLSLATSGAVHGQELSVEEWREDLQHLARVIDEVHPNPYLFNDRDAVQSAINELSASIPEMSDDQVILGMAGIAGMLRDGHSMVIPLSQRFPLTEFAPIRLFATPDGWIVVAVAEEFDWALGTQVLTISGKPTDEVMARLARHSAADNESQRISNAPVGLALGRILRGLELVDESGILSLTVQPDGGSPRSLNIPLLEMPLNFGWTQSPFAAPGENTKSITNLWSETPLAFSHPGEPYWSEYDADHELLYIQINQVNSSDGPTSVNGAESVSSLPDFLARSLALTDDHETQTLVVDLQFNTGGDNFVARELIQILHEYPALIERGRLFVPIGRKTFSAGINFASLFEAYSEALFVGEPAAGRPNHYGDARGFPLPNSGLVARVSTLNWQLGVNPWDIRRMMEPDIWAPFDQSSLNQGIDPVLEAILSYDPSKSLVNRMMVAYEDHSVVAAMALFTTEVQPTEPGIWHYQPAMLLDFGTRLFRRGIDVSEVATVFLEAAELYPDQPSVMFSIGRAASRVPDWRLATQMYERALELWSANDVIATHLARARIELQAAGGQ